MGRSSARSYRRSNSPAIVWLASPPCTMSVLPPITAASGSAANIFLQMRNRPCREALRCCQGHFGRNEASVSSLRPRARVCIRMHGLTGIQQSAIQPSCRAQTASWCRFMTTASSESHETIQSCD